jgi:predicted transcriptional regulator
LFLIFSDEKKSENFIISEANILMRLKTFEEGKMKETDIKLEELMTRPVFSASKDTPIRDITFELFYGFFSGMPITDSNGKVIGIVTEIDILNQIREGKDLEKLKAGDIMTENPITVDVKTPISDVVNLMIDKNIIRIPVIKEGHLVGVIARRDILRYYFQPGYFSRLPWKNV